MSVVRQVTFLSFIRHVSTASCIPLVLVMVFDCRGKGSARFGKICDKLPLRTQQCISVLHNEVHVHGNRILNAYVVLRRISIGHADNILDIPEER